MDKLLDLKPNEFASIVFGIVGMALALVASYRAKRSEEISKRSDERSARAEERSIKNEERARELVFAQKKSDALALILDGEAANMSTRRQLLSLRNDAFEIGDHQIVASAETFAVSYEGSLARLREVRRELQLIPSTGITHEILKQMEAVTASIKEVTNSKSTSEEVAAFTDEARRRIQFITIHQEVSKELKRHATDSGNA